MSIRHLFPVRLIRARPRLFCAALAGLAVILLLPKSVATQEVTRLILGWNVGALLYLVLVGFMVAHASEEKIRYRARLQDEGKGVILLLVVLAAIASLAAIVAQLSAAKDMSGLLRSLHIALGVLTLLTSWAFTHVMFGLHYAHDYYLAHHNGLAPGLDFPGTEPPDYLDFVYFAFVIGTSGQTADVAFSSRAMRRTGLVHCVLAFLFNTTVLALMINIAAGLL